MCIVTAYTIICLSDLPVIWVFKIFTSIAQNYKKNFLLVQTRIKSENEDARQIYVNIEYLALEFRVVSNILSILYKCWVHCIQCSWAQMEEEMVVLWTVKRFYLKHKLN